MLQIPVTKSDKEKEKVTLKLLAVNENKQKLIGMMAINFQVDSLEVLQKQVNFQKSIDSQASITYSASVVAKPNSEADDMGGEDKPPLPR